MFFFGPVIDIIQKREKLGGVSTAEDCENLWMRIKVGIDDSIKIFETEMSEWSAKDFVAKFAQ